MKLFGALQSPFVRKVRVALEEKGISYEIEGPAPSLRDGDSALARFGIAGIAIGAHLGWLEAADFTIDARHWPRTARCSIGRRSRRPPRRSEERRML